MLLARKAEDAGAARRATVPHEWDALLECEDAAAEDATVNPPDSLSGLSSKSQADRTVSGAGRADGEEGGSAGKRRQGVRGRCAH